jgi:phosphatidylethanolamine-binding protein
LKKASIIDEVIDDFEGKCFVVPLYGKKERPVALGNIFKEAKTKGKPALRIYCPHMQSTLGLTIALTDPDAPSRDDPKWSEMCHWISTIPISNQDGVQIDLEGRTEEKDLVECERFIGCFSCIANHQFIDKPPGPPAKTGYHRYVFLLLEGDNSNLTAPEDRQHWGTGKKRHGVRDWAKQEGLEVIGANYFIEKNKKQ